MVLNEFGRVNFLIDQEDELLETDSHVSVTEGYLRDLDMEVDNIKGQEESAILEITKNWPLPNNITGSFSSVIIDKASFEIAICNDPIGVYPLYYLSIGQEFYISNSIILLGSAAQCELDEAGIIQRGLGPEFCNLGSRTILKNCKRLLPGELIQFDKRGDIISKKYDNSLYQEMSKPNQDPKLPKRFWEAYKKEVEYSLNSSKHVNIALSGGIDSRITLAAISKEKDLNCVTFGHDKNYETKIASRLAKIKGAKFRNYSQSNLYFPEEDILRKYTKQTEALYLCSWLEILENEKFDSKSPFLLGDLTTALTGRTIEKFSTKKFRQENFWKHYVLEQDYVFENSTDQSYTDWKKNKLENFARWYTKDRLAQFKFNINKTDLVHSLSSDMNEIFERIESHELPFVELYDELFTWYTHNRMQVAKQILICNKNNMAFSPSMSLQILRKATNIHPNLRLNFRFIKTLFKEFKELNNLAKVPTSQAPYIPQNYPDIIRFGVWGIRSKLDQYFIKRLVKYRNIKMRYRLFESMNWAKIYHNPNMEMNLKDYFHNNHLGDIYFENLLNQSIQRRELNQWPFANIDIMNAASLNMEIDLIKTLRKELNEV
ncbi:hypothetical protein [Gillisia hiemivivida]|uniref:asparagine synthase (glutamine-hydrolyzing) n=1 Tax=Gillisia hiemivivida TaxID=291190 RepID=A0A5C6ZTL3_9FLAO|nr:hypothetical protein [Gillisia hiemivivida]TXD93898.1 hypothetical protein ES724_08215 [Gillisia hiemivivida]